jgi:hypothetical protein
MAVERAIQFRILHQWHVRELAYAKERFAPAEDPMISQRESKNLNPKISERVADSVNPLSPGQTQPKATTGVRIFLQELRDHLQRIRGNH